MPVGYLSNISKENYELSLWLITSKCPLIETFPRGGGKGEGKGLIYKAAGAVVLQINFPTHLNFKDLRVILGIYVIKSNEVL